ncbi:hypothetical protein QZH41_015550 [Actinostola sp. cb2023]|nr:hypothetical protein QZH41_015550 [Actinostola sp. cb2023]
MPVLPTTPPMRVPSRPPNISVSDMNATSASVHWTSPVKANGLLLGYKVIYYGFSNSSLTTKVVAFDVLTLVLNDLQPYTMYTVKVAAFTRIGDGAFVSTQFQTSEAAPSAIRNLTGMAINSTTVALSWKTPEYPNGVIMYVIQSNTSVVIYEGPKTDFIVSGLAAATKYTFVVYAKNIKYDLMSAVREVTVETRQSELSDPPLDVSAFTMTSSSILVQWLPPPSPTRHGVINNYIVEYYTSMDKNAILTETTPDNKTELTLMSLQPYTLYYITVKAVNDAGSGPASEAVSNTTFEDAPSPPTNFTVRSVNATSLLATWSQPDNLNGALVKYRLYSRLTSLNASKDGLVYDGEDTMFLFSGLHEFVNYTITLFAYNVNFGYHSTAVVAMGITHPSVPGPVIIDRVTNVSSTVLQVSWLPPKNPNGILKAFNICWHRIDLPKKMCQLVTGIVLNVTRLEPLTWYNISLVARTSAGEGPEVSHVYRTTEGVPSKPLDLQAWNISATSVYVTWKPPKHTKGILLYYQVFYRPNSSSSVPCVVRPGLSTNTTLYSMHPYTLYVIYVNAATSQGLGAVAKVLVTTDEGVPSGIPYLTAYNVSSTSVDLKWAAPDHPNGRIGYKLVYGSDLSWNTTRFFSDISIGASVSGLLAFTEYTFVIEAYNLKSGRSGPANNRTAMTMAAPPSGPPRNVRLVEATTETLTIVWDPPAMSNGIIQYYEVMVYEGENYKFLDTHRVYRNMVKVKSLKPWHEYTVSVACTSNGGRGPASEKKTFRTLPSVPPTVPPIKPPNKDVITAHEIVIELEKASDTNGQISFYQVVVLELDTTNDGAPIEPENGPDDYTPADLVTYVEAKLRKPKLVPYIAAQFSANEFSKYRVFKVGDAKNFSVSARKRRDATGQYYNGPLEPNTFYVMFQRAAVSKDIYRSTKWTEAVATSELAVPAGRTQPSSTNVGLVAGLCVTFLFIIAVVIVVFSLMWKKRRFAFGVMLDDEGDYSNRSLKLKKIRGSKRRRTSSRGLMGSTDSLDNIDDINRRRQPIPMEEFTNHVRRMHIDGDIGFSEEYELVQPDDKEFTWHHSLLPVNKHKNRYANIIAYDHSRVLLTPVEGVPGSDYINCNYIDGYSGSGAYIASQGPLPETFDDFWRMIWEQGTATIVMLTQLEERGRRKCDQYWPDRGTQTYGVMRVTASESSHMSYYNLRTFILSHKQEEEEPRQVKQYHFTSWPDHGVPTHPVPLLSLVRTVSNANPSTAGPTLVHCSAGVGRTGTYITLDSVLQRIEKEQTIDVYEFVQQMRTKRNLMVQTESQYVFIHDALVEAVSCGITEFEAKKFGSRLREMREVDPETGRTYMEKEFLRLLKDERHHSTFKAANMGVNSSKNRYLNILPYEPTRVPLKMRPGEVGSDYINASYIDGYCRRNVYIATQAPLPGTFEDYWRMIWEQGSCVIVMLTREEEAGKVKCHRYWPSDGTRIFGNVLVELTEEVSYPDYIMRQFTLTHTEEKDSRVVRQYQYTDWPDIGLPESGVGIIDLIGQVEKWQQQSYNSIITGHCSGGVGRTGVYCAISILIERVKAEGVIDVFQTVQSLRLQRPAMVQTLEQYEFCYSTLQEYLDSFDLYANFY